ncbi:CLUMA_CG015500, isoform A [Clunio marinus]|uniref:CLUMA_CG015500, isoform A n=1 Tax=Clunio marinus TaxID=568069 RepID=A0A1J1IT92_9DIPT|nr:CLUMA_CG015500, isoform A [Clunio marinus]
MKVVTENFLIPAVISIKRKQKKEHTVSFLKFNINIDVCFKVYSEKNITEANLPHERSITSYSEYFINVVKNEIFIRKRGKFLTPEYLI